VLQDSIASVLAPFEQPIDLLGTATSLGEILGFVTGAACVWLVVRRNVWNFPVGIANVTFLGLLFLDARLYADACLQVVYIALQVFGWWAWLRLLPQRSQQDVKRGGRLPWIALGLALAGTAILFPILRAVGDSAPFWDALTTALSLSAQGLLAWKHFSNWWFWIAADLIYVPLYATKQLPLTACVYVLFLGLCVYGLADWRKAARPLPRARAELRGEVAA
jgi:nicotinamide mononucleotide transporter